jgi:hypothetical protein
MCGMVIEIVLYFIVVHTKYDSYALTVFERTRDVVNVCSKYLDLLQLRYELLWLQIGPNKAFK